jgi:hypothetical protein
MRVAVSNPAACASSTSRPLASNASPQAISAGIIAADTCPNMVLDVLSKSSTCAAVPLTSAASRQAARRFVPKIRLGPWLACNSNTSSTIRGGASTDPASVTPIVSSTATLLQ